MTHAGRAEVWLRRECTARMRHWTCECGVVALLLAGSAMPAAAQVTYTVFPVQNASAASSPAQPAKRGMQTPVTLVVQDSTVLYAVNELSRQAHLRPIYNDGPLLAKRRITVHLANMGVGEAFATVLAGTGLTATMAGDGETVVIGTLAGHSVARPPRIVGGSIGGRVTDSASGQGLGGAVVRVDGIKLSAVTSDSGNFTLKDVPSGDQVLSVKLFGYRPADRTVTVVDSERTTVKIVLVPIPTVLSGVVTTAVGQQKRYEVGSDITVLNADSIQKVAPVTNITDMLETRVPGLIVQHTNGIPGAPSRLRLRGLSSINMSSDPILIIDGIRVYADQSGSVSPTAPATNGNAAGGSGSVIGGGSTVAGRQGTVFAGPSALDQIDPSSIQTIEVLKGPSATAIYGSDAANGVIVVTTKHGRVGPTHWTLSLDQGRTTLPGSWPTNYYRFIPSTLWYDPGSELSTCQIPGFVCYVDSLVAFQALNDPRYSPLTGDPGHDRDASLTVSGGSGTLTYSVTGSASTQSGYLHLPPIELERFQLFHGFPAPGWMRTPDQYNTYGGTSQLTVQLGHQGATLALTSKLLQTAQQQSSLQGDLSKLASEFVDTTQLSANPLFPDYYTRAQLNTTTFTNAVSLNNWAPLHWLPSITATAGLNIQQQNNNSVEPRDYIICTAAIEAGPNPCGPNDTLGQFSLSQGTNSSGSLTVGTVFVQRLVSTAVGVNVYTLGQSTYSEQVIGLPLGVSIPTGEGILPSSNYSSVNTATYGWYVQPTLNLNSRFFVSPGFRLDGGSASGANSGVQGSNLSLFPKIDFSYVAVSRPPSHPMFGVLTLLRPRIAVGVAGIQPGPGQQLRLLQASEATPLAADGSVTSPVDILHVQTLGNPKLHPERDRELEGGVDAQFGNQRLVLNLTAYDKRAYDAILSVPVAPSAVTYGGPTSFEENVGNIRNTGVEATAFARLLESRLVDWSVNANVASNHNRLVSLAPGVQTLDAVTQSVGGASTRIVPGYPLFGLWAQPIAGYADVNHDGKIEANEVVVGDSAVFVGAQEPNYELTVSTSIALFNNRLTITTSVDYQNGLTQDMSGGQSSLLINAPNLSLAQQAALTAVSQAGIQANQKTAIGALATVNTLRWNTLAVTFLAPPGLAHAVRVPSLSFALQGSNLGLHSNYRGVDPNVNAFASGNLTQDTGGLLPQPRVWSLRVVLGN